MSPVTSKMESLRVDIHWLALLWDFSLAYIAAAFPSSDWGPVSSPCSLSSHLPPQGLLFPLCQEPQIMPPFKSLCVRHSHCPLPPFPNILGHLPHSSKHGSQAVDRNRHMWALMSPGHCGQWLNLAFLVAQVSWRNSYLLPTEEETEISATPIT